MATLNYYSPRERGDSDSAAETYIRNEKQRKTGEALSSHEPKPEVLKVERRGRVGTAGVFFPTMTGVLWRCIELLVFGISLACNVQTSP